MIGCIVDGKLVWVETLNDQEKKKARAIDQHPSDCTGCITAKGPCKAGELGAAVRDNKELVVLKGVRKDGPVYCPSCGSRVHFLKTVAGKMMPCEMDLRRGDGKMTLTDHDGVTHRKAPDTVFGYESHFAFCRGAKEHRRTTTCRSDGMEISPKGGAK